jgi:4-hydroxy-tetrahydrodipicolinate synthase
MADAIAREFGEQARERVDRLPRGIVASSATPATPEGELLDKLVGPHIDWLIAEGVDGISPLGSSGEFVALSSDQRRHVIETVVAAVDGRVHVMAGSHHYSTSETVALSRHAESAGADSLLIVPPYYMCPSPGEVMDHYRRVADNVSIPIVLYHNAAGSRVDLSTDQIARLFEEGVLSGVKMSNPDPDRIRQLIDATADACRVYVGIDVVAFDGLCQGAHGWISGIPSIVPRKAGEMYQSIAVDGDLARARAQWRALAPLMRLQFRAFLGRGEGPQWLAVSKAVLNLIGPPVGSPILPIQPIGDEDLAQLRKLLADLGYTTD